jgi:hypothetical protein
VIHAQQDFGLSQQGGRFSTTTLCNQNGIPYVDYFPNITQRAVFVDPFIAIDKLGEFDVWASVKGGGFTGQSGAIPLLLLESVLESVSSFCLFFSLGEDALWLYMVSLDSSGGIRQNDKTVVS